MTITRLLFLLILFLLIRGEYNTAEGQVFQNIMQAEEALCKDLTALNVATNDSTRRLCNQKFSDDLLTTLVLPSSDNHPFDSLKTLTRISSPDNKFRIFQWNLPDSDGRSRFYGFIKITGSTPAKIFPLVDFSDSLPMPDTMVLDHLHWPGALYYKIIQGEQVTGKIFYTMLGWAGRNALTAQKVIEILSFNDIGKPCFGLKVFPDYGEGNMARIVFRFAATTGMSIKYEQLPIASDKRWNSRKRIFEYTMKNAWIIVCDRMVPLDPQLDGQYQYYVAAGDIFDGFIFKHNYWSYMKGIDIRKKQ